MPTFQYTARDRAGQSVTGTISGQSEREVRSTLRRKDLFVTACKVTGGVMHEPAQSFVRRINLNDLVVMSRQLATLVRSGLSIIESLDAVYEQSENIKLKTVIEKVRLDVLSGRTLADAIAEHPAVFSNIYVGLVAAGEAGGTLDQTLEVAADQLNDEMELREQVKSAVAYPILVVVATVLVVSFMLLVVVPVFANIYNRFRADLPGITQTLLTMSDWTVRFWWVALLAGLGGWIAFRQYAKTFHGKRRVDAAKMRIPLLGKLLRKISIARFTQTWCGMTKGGVPILTALEVSARTCGNSILEDAILALRDRVKEGAGLAVPLADSGEFPPLVTRMVASGERSGNLDEMLTEVTKFYKRDIDHGIQRLTRMLEPAMTVVIGGIVLFVLLALYLPVFNLGNVVK